jgi:hypothetical protein
MLRNTADAQADVARFITRVAKADVVWYLASESGPAISFSNADLEAEEEPTKVLLFFSDLGYAKRAQVASFPRHRASSMQLFDFMYRWLPGMSRDGVLAGPNWTADLTGLELDAFELRKAISAAMTQDHSERHEKLYRQLSGQS